MALRPHTATLNRNSPRYADWITVFGDDTVPIETPIPARGDLPGLGVVDVYKLDVKALTPEQRGRLVCHLAARFGDPPELVERLIDDPAHGVPLVAKDLTSIFDARYVL